VLAERRDGGIDDVRLHSLELLVAEPQALHRADAEVLGHHVGVPDQFFEELCALRSFELECDGELVPLSVLGGRHALLDTVARALDAERDALAPAVARLDLDDAGAHVGQQHGAEGHGDDLPQVEYGDIAQRLVLVHGLDGGPILTRRRVPGQAASQGPLRG